jgi:hypothetical protein
VSYSLQLISTLAALIVEPPRADAASEAPIAARLRVVLGEGEGREAGRVSRMAHLAWRGGADAQVMTDAQSNLHVKRFKNAETNGQVNRCSGL